MTTVEAPGIYHVIPACADIVLVYLDDQSGELFATDQVIAWMIEVLPPTRNGGKEPGCMSPLPITASGHQPEVHGYLYPDGRVEVPFDKTYKNLGEAQAEVTKDRTKNRLKKKRPLGA
jgi:hypothetical protein